MAPHLESGLVPTTAKDGKKTAEEEQLEKNMKQLNLLHIKVRGSLKYLFTWRWRQLPIAINYSIANLHCFYGQCRELRTTIQRMLETIPHNATPEEVYKVFVKSVAAANTQIKDFGTLYNSEESKKVLEQAKKSREANPKGIKPWRARDHPDWLEIDQEV
ncbi:uncharacterized protein F4822DRAFT_1494 [Hypoxylon trugodes]|uniref:uncharacterized protein n=1 Tax=Hypoxylon trugodes TaxID=326681 RepID=UPI00218DC48E|nr:uncharacterized protein F4822DRAFT_1494 [Hypoxylon trugodes]KAI1393146.1 hypothetical protein F4822DRAFT_1494 [Hypoxylon trugodes]